MIKILKTIVSALLLCTAMVPFCIQTRSVHRPKGNEPHLTFKWVGSSREYHLQCAHLEEYPWFGTFDPQIFEHYALPAAGIITFRNDPDHSVNAATLKEQIDYLLIEIKQRKKSYTHFMILQDQDFNRKHACGLIVLKFNEWPFVVKLFIETPQNFTNPWSNGFIPIFLFYMGGGVNRHLSGFTRLKNRAYIKQRLAQDQTWAAKVDVPRKWAYIPEQYPFIDIVSTNMGPHNSNHTQIPGTYVIIADAIEADEKSFKDNALAIDLCNFLTMQIDPHRKNFMIEKSTQKIVIVDTEHLPTMMGFKEQVTLRGYVSWYKEVIYNCGKKMLFSTKDDRRRAQQASTDSFHALFFSIPEEIPAEILHNA